MKVRVNFGDSMSNRSRDIRLPQIIDVSFEEIGAKYRRNTLIIVNIFGKSGFFLGIFLTFGLEATRTTRTAKKNGSRQQD